MNCKFLVGTNELPSIITLDDGSDIALGDLVGAAFARSSLTIDQWNAAHQSVRDDLLRAEIRFLNAVKKQ